MLRLLHIFKDSDPTIGGDLWLFMGNAFCVLAALLLGGVYGGLAGSLGMTVVDHDGSGRRHQRSEDLLS